MVHSSMRAVGPILGGPNEMIEERWGERASGSAGGNESATEALR